MFVHCFTEDREIESRDAGCHKTACAQLGRSGTAQHGFRGAIMALTDLVPLLPSSLARRAFDIFRCGLDNLRASLAELAA